MINKRDMLRRRTPWFAVGVIALVGFISLTNAKTKTLDSQAADEASTTWLTSDGTRPDYVPETSWLNEDGRIQDKVDYPFVEDPAVLGTWTGFDFVAAIEDFDPAERNWRGRIHFRKVEFIEQGYVTAQFGDARTLEPLSTVTWTSGLLLSVNPREQTAEELEIRSFDGVDYLFLQWKSGDYTIRHDKPSYCVFVRGDVDVEPYRPDDAEADYVNDGGRRDSAPQQVWSDLMLEPYDLPEDSAEAARDPSTWNTPDGLRPDYVPETSWLDERGRVQDETDYPFVDDPAVLGMWATVDFVGAIDDFDPAERSFKGGDYLRRLEFLEQGHMKSQFQDDPLRPAQRMRWTNGLWLFRCPHEHTASEYVIESIDGVDYLFLQWKSGDYTIRHQTPGYYVMSRADY